ncbi:hypothetical protein FIBSPDRAFT_859508, partial [Athelia psychrophila]
PIVKQPAPQQRPRCPEQARDRSRLLHHLLESGPLGDERYVAVYAVRVEEEGEGVAKEDGAVWDEGEGDQMS